MDTNHKKLENYISKILQIQNKKNAVLKTDDLKEIALEMGMTESDWNSISDTFNAHALRGKGFLEYKNWIDAIKEFEQAHTLNPYNTDILYGLALSHKELWLQTNDNSHRTNAEKYAKSCINIEPEYKEAIKLISDLRKSNNLRKGGGSQQNKSTKSETSSKKRNTIMIARLLGFALFIGFIFWYSTNKKGKELEKESAQKIIEKADELVEAKELFVPLPVEEKEPSLPIVLSKTEKSKGLRYISESSTLSDYDDSYSVTAKGYFQLKEIEIDALKVKVDVLDQNDKVILSNVKELVSDGDLAYRNGDLVTFDFLDHVKEADMPNFKVIRLSVNYIKKETGTFKYKASKVLKVAWEIEKPSNFDIAIRERLTSVSESYGTVYNKIVLEVENTGNSTINKLQLQIKWFNKQDKVVNTEEIYITIDSYSPLKRGTTHLYDRMFGIEGFTQKAYKGYSVSVLSVD